MSGHPLVLPRLEEGIYGAKANILDIRLAQALDRLTRLAVHLLLPPFVLLKRGDLDHPLRFVVVAAPEIYVVACRFGDERARTVLL